MAKAKPGALNYGSAGNGSAGHLAFEYLKMRHRHGHPACAVQGNGSDAAGPAGRAHRGDLRRRPRAALRTSGAGSCAPIAVGTRAAHPGAARRADRGRAGLSDFETSQWYGVMVPAGTPREIVMKLNAEINKALQSSAVTAALRHRQRRGRDRHAGAVRRPHRRRAGALAGRGGEGEDHDRVRRPARPRASGHARLDLDALAALALEVAELDARPAAHRLRGSAGGVVVQDRAKSPMRSAQPFGASQPRRVDAG